MRSTLIVLLFPLIALAADPPIPDAAKSAKGLDSALATLRAPTRDTKPLSAADSLKRFKLPPGYTVDLIADEPNVRQPLNLRFDSRGRMWVTQYIQYPFPKGLKVVEYDRYIRAKFDKVPLPPPRGDKGADKITIHEDTNGDGTFDKQTTFIDGLNIATAALPDKDGAWIMNPPYLLFYPDANHDDVSDADPVVHLSGFGLEDTHAVANSLTWGPDGWIYAAQGSTCTAKVKIETSTKSGLAASAASSTTDFLGQAIWRYHPTQHRFELFAEGGGNTFGVELDDLGRLYSGTNWSNFRGFHYVQGGYYVKGWGKHGPLTNPFAFGFFDHMPHTGAIKRLSHTYAVYGGGLMPALTGKIVAPNSLQSRIEISRLEQIGSTFKTVEEEPLMTSDDGWFRPVDLKVGPDGAIYIADFYENRISHVDPRDTWDRANGRIWRIRPTDWKPARPADLAQLEGPQLLDRLKDPNRAVRDLARQIIHNRGLTALAAPLRQTLANDQGQLALEALWTLHALKSMDEPNWLIALHHKSPHVRRWAVRLLADDSQLLPTPTFERLVELAKSEKDSEVRSQLASSAKRLPADQAIPILKEMLTRVEDANDPHIPLLIWWAAEAKLHTHRDAVVEWFGDTNTWCQQNPALVKPVGQRVARWLATSLTEADQKSLLYLFQRSGMLPAHEAFMAGIIEAFQGRQIPRLLPELAARIARSDNLELLARLGDKKALATLIKSIDNEDPKFKTQRLAHIELLGQVGPPEAVPALLKIATTSKQHAARKSALAALTRFSDQSIGQQLVAAYPSMPKDQAVRPAAISTLLARKTWSLALLKAIESGSIPKQDLAPDQLDRLRQSSDKAIAAMLQNVFGQLTRPSSEQKEKEIARIKQVVQQGGGDPSAGKTIYTARCAACHRLLGEGGQVGPDLTPYERRNLDFLLVSIVDPSAAIREEYTNFRIDTEDDQTFVGLIKERAPDAITLIDATQQKTIIPKKEIKEEQALTLSIMPESLLDGLDEIQLKDLLAYLQSEKPVK